LIQLRRDRGGQPRVLGQPDQVIHAVALAPAEDLLAAEAAVGADDDLDLGPGLPDLRHDPLQVLHRPGAGVDVGGPQPGAEQVIAAEDVQRQVAVALVIAVEEASQLMAVGRVVGGIEVEHDPFGRTLVGLEEEGHEEAFDVAGAAGDLLVSAVLAGADGGQFEAVERALAGQRLAPVPLASPGLARGVGLADDGGEQGIAPQVVVVVEALVAQRQGVNPLGDQVGDGVLDEVRVAMVGETGGELMDDAGELLGLSEQERAAVGGDGAAVEIGEDLAGTEHGKVEIG
jgi:hypothetical protein